MNKKLQQKFNILKNETTPKKEWVSDLRSELLEEEKIFFFEELTLNFAFGSLASVAMVLFFVFNILLTVPEVNMVENKVNHRVTDMVVRLQQREEVQEDMMAMNQTEDEIESEPMITEIDFESLDDNKKREAIRQSTEVLLAEVREMEERIARVMASQSH